MQIAMSLYDPLALDLSVPARGGQAKRMQGVQHSVHRALDMVCALFIFVALLPLMALLCVTVYLCDPGPILFAHRRVGRGGRMFRCWKFRTMVKNADVRLATYLQANPEALIEWNRDHKLRDDPRVTVVGSFLRRSSLDELPQLFNVIMGTMSLVGPRPIVPEECWRYGRYIRHYATVRPGITGLWQISGRNNISYRRRVAYDVLYCRKRSILFDTRIIALTLPSVAMQRGAY